MEKQQGERKEKDDERKEKSINMEKWEMARESLLASNEVASCDVFCLSDIAMTCRTN